ncbi:hypothetical protein [Streptomyces sp. LS1784]|uniref:hypothetical protein n=1 Tax=Streptomyces sp. LS1784 TaxID=2851533 RepID=UPI001CCACB08|nr:hypothetical protein [Streptomyces sp. LS1784]
METTVCIAQQPEADALLTRSPLALLVGALPNRQAATEWAFTGPLVIARRMGAEDLDAHRIAPYSPPEFAALLAAPPAVHDSPSVDAEDKLWVNSVPREELAKFTFEPVLGGLKVLSAKGHAWHASHRGTQIELSKPKAEFQETWTLEYVRPIGEE